MTNTTDWLEWAEDVTDPDARADLARWAVSLRRAFAAETRQIQGKLTSRGYAELTSDGVIPLNVSGHCCLGVWCAIKTADGTLRARPSGTEVAYQPTDGEYLPQSSTLPTTVRLAGSNDPDLLAFLDREDAGEGSLEELAAEHGYWLPGNQAGDVEQFVRYERKTATAAELNDDHGLNFGQIADVIVWRYQLTAQELATAEAAPRVPEVEGPEPEAKAG